jgi:hypothetical protein
MRGRSPESRGPSAGAASCDDLVVNLDVPAAGPRPEHWLPGLRTIRAYRRSWLGHDVVAGLVVATPLVPAGMGYAEAAGLPAVSGLYATMTGVAWTDWEDRS